MSNPTGVYFAWNRLETSSRSKSAKRILKAEIHDPLWMLGRQWQMGEFKGDDTGSGILAKAKLSYSTINSVYPINPIPPITTINSLPIEPIVESVNYNFSIKERVLLWKKWCELLELKVPTTSCISFFHAINSNLQSNVIIDINLPLTPAPTDDEIAVNAIYQSNKRLVQFLNTIALSKSNIDGYFIYEVLKGKLAGATFESVWDSTLLSSSSVSNIISTYLPQLSMPNFEAANIEFIAWVESIYTNLKTDITKEYWNNRKMEYQLRIEDNNGEKFVAEKYHEGKLDWYDFEVSQSASPSTVTTVCKEMIMTKNRFAGMPCSRWWEFENGAVNFCISDLQTSDTTKIILTQFALVYQDDWFAIPFKLPVGSYTSIDGIVVTDVFGIKTYIANQSMTYDESNHRFDLKNNDYWNEWSWMDMHYESNQLNSQRPTGKLLILATTGKTLESKPIESVSFIRDEMSNMVWAIEKRIPDMLGKGKDGYEVARDYLSYLKNNKPVSTIVPNLVNQAGLSYQLMNTVPENWIPFVPKHVGQTNRAIQLQRATMPRFLEQYNFGIPNTMNVRPRTQLLSYVNGSGTSTAYYINEEEVSRAGAIVETSFQRTRWYDGKTFLWVGRYKSTGKGEGSSGLHFDKISTIN
jgi:hypothetical protein